MVGTSNVNCANSNCSYGAETHGLGQCYSREQTKIPSIFWGDEGMPLRFLIGYWREFKPLAKSLDCEFTKSLR